jgi:hypothetical protein
MVEVPIMGLDLDHFIDLVGMVIGRKDEAAREPDQRENEEDTAEQIREAEIPVRMIFFSETHAWSLSGMKPGWDFIQG